MTLFRVKSENDTVDLDLIEGPGPVLVDFHGMYFLISKVMLENARRDRDLRSKLIHPKNSWPNVYRSLRECVPVPSEVARILLEDIADDLPEHG